VGCGEEDRERNDREKLDGIIERGNKEMARARWCPEKGSVLA
jgi:hypothetical protein